MAKLIIRDGKGGERVHEITDDVTTFGRSSANIIQIKDDKASRQHFRIEKAGDSFRLADLGSRNGTEVNGVKVSNQTLKPGDAITVGQYRILFDAPVQVSGDELGATVAVEPLSDKDLAHPGPAAAPAAPAPAPAKPAEPTAPRFILEIVEGGNKGKTVELGVESITIGRHASNKLCIEDEAASNYHAEVTKEAIGYVISDLGSTNGTKVNGEKIVKSPLAHNARIRIGSTEIAFKNLGAPTEEDAVFGTVVLDSEKLDKELVAARSSGGAAAFLKLLVAAALIVGAGYGGYVLFGKLWHNGEKLIPSTEVLNPGFNLGTEPNGTPKDWTVADNKDTRNIVMVDKEKGRESAPKGQPQPEKYALKFQRDSAVKADTLMACQQTRALEVDKAAGYCASVYLQSPGAQGLYGLRLTWVGPEGRELDEFATVSGPHPDWTEVKLETLPPPWAGTLRLACVAYGNVGSVWFDDVALRKIDAAKATRAEEVINYLGLKATFDASGRLELERGGARALGAMFVAQGQGKLLADQKLARLVSGYPRKQGEETVFRGGLYDFASRQVFNYELAASKSSNGLRLRYTFSTDGPEVTLDSLALQVDVYPAFGGKAEVFTAAGRKPLAQGETAGVTELVLSSLKGGTVLALGFAQPATVTMEAFGQKRELNVLLAKEPTLSAAPREFALALAPTSTREADEIEAAFAVVFKLFDEKSWQKFPGEAKKVRDKYPAAGQLKKLDDLEKQYGEILAAARKQADDAVKRARDVKDNPDALTEAYKQGRKEIEGLQERWPDGTALASHLKDCLVEMEKFQADLKQAELERLAQDSYETARKTTDKTEWPNLGEKRVAYILAKNRFETLLKQYPSTKAAANVKRLELVKACEETIKQVEFIGAEEDRILQKIRNYDLNKQYDRAIQIIKSDPSFQRYGRDMKDLTKKLADLEAAKKDAVE